MDQEVNIIRIENWKRLILEANNSGLSKTEWCRQNNISSKTFFYWQRKVRLMEARKALSSSELPSVSTGQKAAISPDFVDMTHLYKETTAPTGGTQGQVPENGNKKKKSKMKVC
ncbi:MAG: IS66 family insertion sequence element accessory protein TnpA [Oliverpabstia sp.]